MLLSFYSDDLIEAGCDEAGRGCLSGPVIAASVILPKDYTNARLNDSKQLSEKRRELLKKDIIHNAIGWAIGVVDNETIDQINILNASIEAMHRSLDKLSVKPEFILIDGNRFKPYRDIPYKCIIKGDGKYNSIAAASILAKCFRDNFMKELSLTFPGYGWEKNMGYPTKEHREGIKKYGITPYHRKSFTLLDEEYPCLF